MKHSKFKHDDGGDIFLAALVFGPLVLALLVGNFLHSDWFQNSFLPWLLK